MNKAVQDDCKHREARPGKRKERPDNSYGLLLASTYSFSRAFCLSLVRDSGIELLFRCITAKIEKTGHKRPRRAPGRMIGSVFFKKFSCYQWLGI
ncbi:MAG: hypothetical protein L3J18_00305 [Candidatus Brocadia sp.]|nr:MAG: hypothetical protein L3J18_00305 [Candidatus Brocadia sp.]